ncbi:MAG TPA: hypothetical protein VGS58_08555 [Candidatus Sulfopaludibacter sp.]|nr:hypothetical protein [Candidatus Sulfopaludibacter sp.]
MPPKLVPDPENFTPAKAPLLRQSMDKAIRESFATDRRKLPGGETIYSGSLAGTGLAMRIDFAAMGIQPRYGVDIPDETRTLFIARRSYEGL